VARTRLGNPGNPYTWLETIQHVQLTYNKATEQRQVMRLRPDVPGILERKRTLWAGKGRKCSVRVSAGKEQRNVEDIIAMTLIFSSSERILHK
jgi:hypothetical protein